MHNLFTQVILSLIFVRYDRFLSFQRTFLKDFLFLAKFRLILKNHSPVNISIDGSINKVCTLWGMDDWKPIIEGYYQKRIFVYRGREVIIVISALFKNQKRIFVYRGREVVIVISALFKNKSWIYWWVKSSFLCKNHWINIFKIMNNFNKGYEKKWIQSSFSMDNSSYTIMDEFMNSHLIYIHLISKICSKKTLVQG